ncbi:MAG: hypothetical protein ABIL58_20995 [Pseudomonadota bacterium]
MPYPFRKMARYIRLDRCTGCRSGIDAFPVTTLPSDNPPPARHTALHG